MKEELKEALFPECVRGNRMIAAPDAKRFTQNSLMAALDHNPTPHLLTPTLEHSISALFLRLHNKSLRSELISAAAASAETGRNWKNRFSAEGRTVREEGQGLPGNGTAPPHHHHHPIASRNRTTSVFGWLSTIDRAAERRSGMKEKCSLMMILFTEDLS